jgi:hypothetical protein
MLRPPRKGGWIPELERVSATRDSSLVQHRTASRVAVEEKPDVLSDWTNLERFYAGLADEYGLVERDGPVNRELTSVGHHPHAARARLGPAHRPAGAYIFMLITSRFCSWCTRCSSMAIDVRPSRGWEPT